VRHIRNILDISELLMPYRGLAKAAL
jgi:hypothetical protein